MYGRRMKSNGYAPVISKFIKSIRNRDSITIYGDGEQTRGFLYVDDAVEATLLALRTQCSSEIFNIGTGKSTSINELARLLMNLTGVKVKVRRKKARVGEIKHSHADISKATQKLGFRPKVELKKGLLEILS